MRFARGHQVVASQKPPRKRWRTQHHETLRDVSVPPEVKMEMIQTAMIHKIAVVVGAFLITCVLTIWSNITIIGIADRAVEHACYEQGGVMVEAKGLEEFATCSFD